MNSFKKGSIWKKTDIIDLPFLPFDGEKKVTSKMINESAKYIRKVKNVNFREANFEQNFKNERKFVFYQADTLIGLDISIIDISSLTYLDQFFFLLKMYPMVMINSFIPEESMKKIALQSYCLEHYYILPVFGSMPFWDKALSGSYYGEDIIKIFTGEMKECPIENLIIRPDQSSINELKARFPQFLIEDGKVSFQPQITWLGVTDKQIEELLEHLFNDNIEKFDFQKVCEEYSIEESKLALYIEKSMLFYKNNDNEIIFRLNRKYIYWGFICNLATQFEKEMIERDAIYHELKIDESIGTIKKIDEKVYHKLGNLFNKQDSFSYKMFSSIKRLLDTRKYSNVLIINNGNMDGIISMLQDIEMQDNLYEVLDYYSVAVKYPDIKYERLKDQSVLIITDIINTGKLIRSTIDFLKYLGCKKIGIFSFIVNRKFNTNNMISDENIELFYLTEKELNEIDQILDKEYSRHFEEDRDLNFRLLWGDVGKDISLEESENPYFYHMSDKELYKNYYNYGFTIQGEDISPNSYIYQKVNRILADRDLILIYKKYEFFRDLIRSIIKNEKLANGLRVEQIDDTEVNLLKVTESYENKRALFIVPVNLTKNIKNYIEANKVNDSEFLDVVGCEIYSLDKDEIMHERNKDKKCVFPSKLKRYISLSNNPEIDYLKG